MKRNHKRTGLSMTAQDSTTTKQRMLAILTASFAPTVLDVLDESPLYARVDMVRGADGRLLLIELEVIEPYLFPQDGPGIGAVLGEALAKRIG